MKLLVVFSIVIFLGFLFYANEPMNEQIKRDVVKAEIASVSSAKTELPEAGSSVDHPTPKSTEQSDTRDYNAGAIAADWLTRIGKLSNEERADYAHYDEETLINLAENGDMKAMDALSNLYINRGVSTDNNYNNARKYAEKAAIYGSVGTIPTLAFLALHPMYEVEGELNQSTTSQRKSPHEKLIESMALSRTIAIRGDKNLSSIIEKNTLSQFKSTYNPDITISPEIEQEINSKAQEYYNDWKSKRSELGLGDFEEMPVSLKKYTDMLNASSK